MPQIASWLEGQLVREYPMFGMPVGRYFGGASGPGTWMLTRNLQRKTPGPEVRVALEPHPRGGTVVTVTTTENAAVARGYGAVLFSWLGFLVLAGIPMALSEPSPHAHPILPMPILALLIVLVLGGTTVGVYLAARAMQRAGAIRARGLEVEHFVLSLHAVPA
jgi:hypothetical protein